MGAPGAAPPINKCAGRVKPVKHSLTLRGHRTSVTLEAPFWEAFRQLATREGLSLNSLAAELDAARDPEVGLASTIRVYVLEALQSGR